jgi:phosphatidylglycerol:prolipoprotein diacylglycerol transferase
MLDALALGLAVGLAFGRVGCYSVGEHLGGPTGFFLGTRYDGGDTREGPPAVGTVIHNTSLYELLFLLVIAALLWWLLRQKAVPGSMIGWSCTLYAIGRFSTDFLREYDDTVLGLTGAQWMCVALLPAGLVILFKVRRSLARQTYDEPAALDTSESYTDASSESTTG